MDSKYAAQILEGLAAQKQGYTHLLELAGQQKAAIDASDDARLVQLVKDKQACVAELTQSEKTLTAATEALTDAERRAMQERAGDLQKEVLNLIEQVIAVENACTEALKSKKLETRDELADLKNRKQSIQQYGMFKNKGTEFSGNA